MVEIPEELLLLKEWESRLGLEDWNITLTARCHPEDMALEDCTGCVSYEETTKTAVIQIINPDLLGERVCRPFDFEEVLVHEMLHLKFCLLERGNNWEKKLQLRVLHQIIDDMSRALVDAKRFSDKAKSEKKKTSKENVNV